MGEAQIPLPWTHRKKVSDTFFDLLGYRSFLLLMNPPLHRRRPPQISLGSMMLLMIVFSIMSAGLFYASRVPVVQEELDVLVHGKAGGSGAETGRLAHIIFIMFTFTSPLILAGILSTAVTFMRWFERRT